jgi:hypothetical protein
MDGDAFPVQCPNNPSFPFLPVALDEEEVMILTYLPTLLYFPYNTPTIETRRPERKVCAPVLPPPTGGDGM